MDGVSVMPVYIYDSEADALQVLLVDEAEMNVAKTEEVSATIHVDL